MKKMTRDLGDADPFGSREASHAFFTIPKMSYR
jgi:hypothetical protein